MLIAALFFALSFGDGAGVAISPRTIPTLSKANTGIEPCGLLPSAEITRIHGAKVVETKPSEGTAAASLQMLQCYFRAEDLAESVSLLVAVPSEKHPNAARDYWRATIVRAAEAEVSARSSGTELTKAEAKKQRHRPERVEGIGEQAWWVGDRYAGALYVLEGDKFIRVSVGGRLSEKEKKQQARELAAVVLKQL
jgi:hypothetical protein